MSNITYPAKTVAGGGGSTYVEGNSLPAAELQADFDAVANVVNGNLDEDNLSGGTQIPNSKLAQIADTKVDDYSADATEAAATSTPGDSATLGSNLATDLSEEIEHLRYRIHANAGYKTGTVYRNSSGTNVTARWVEPPIRGRNLIYNSGFEVFSGASGDAPDGWTEAGTLASTAIEVPANVETGIEKRSLAITTDAASEGMSQTIGGLRSDTKYLIAVKYFRTSGTINFAATGAIPTGDYQNCVITDSSSSGVQVASMIVQSTSAAASITLSITESTGSGDFNLVQAWMFELNDDWPNTLPDIPTQTASASTENQTLPTTFNTSWDSNWTTDTALSLSQYVPGPGYRLIYEAQIQFAGDPNSAGGGPDVAAHFGFRLRMNDGSDSTVDGPYFWTVDQDGVGYAGHVSVMSLRHVVDNATPGVTYAFSYQVTAHSAGSTSSRPRLHPLVNPTASGTATGNTIQSVSRARLRVERM